MILYHGSIEEIKRPDVSKSRKSLDFGKGFYMTSIRQQAIDWAHTKKEENEQCVLNTYELDIEMIRKKYRVKEFDSYDEEWLQFILDRRKEKKENTRYDLIIGGVADDKVYSTIVLYTKELIEKDKALKRLSFKKKNDQYCITNQRIIDKHLLFISSEVFKDGNK